MCVLCVQKGDGNFTPRCKVSSSVAQLVVLQLVFDGKLHAVIASVLCEAISSFSVRSAARDCFVATRRLLAMTGGLISIIYELKDH